MQPVQADTAEIQDAATRFGGVAGAVKPAYGKLDTSALGFPSAEGAVTAFAVGWEACGSIFSEVLTSVQGALQQTATNYELAEVFNVHSGSILTPADPFSPVIPGVTP